MKSEWRVESLGEVCRFIDYRGRTPEKTRSGLRLITAKNVKMGFLQRHPLEFVKPDTYESWMTRGIPKLGDVLFTTEAPLANVAQLDTDEKVVFAQRIIVLQPTEPSLDRSFLKYLLMSDSTQQLIRQEGTGATVQGIKASLLKAIKIRFPSLPEQQRIVGILDEVFDGIATAKANAEKSLQNAHALMRSTLQSALSSRGCGWLSTTIGEQVTLQRGFDITKIEQRSGKVPVVSSGGIKSFHDTAMVPGPGVVLGRKGTLGKVFYLDEDFWPHDTTLWVKKFNENNPRFVYYFFTNLGVTQLDSGTANPALNRNQVHPIKVDWPPVAQQKDIAEKLDAIATETRRLESIYQQKLAALDALKKSLLDRAFSGNL
jgi:type I restriction enzyme, S subunit